MLAGTWQIITNGWSKPQADRCAAARKKIAEALGPEKPAYYEILYAHVLALHGEYRDAYEIARSGLERAAETRSLVVYLSSLSSLALALMHLGWRGELRGDSRERHGTLPRRTATTPWRGLFAAMLGWLRTQSFDFADARRIAGSLLQTHAEEPAGQVRNHRATGPLPSMWIWSVGSRKMHCNVFLNVRDRQGTPKFFLQWYWRMISEFGLVGAYLKLGNLDQAGVAAGQFLDDALTTADPALRAPAWDAMARVAVQKGDFTRALQFIGEAFREY